MKISFIGFGNMAKAIAQGFQRKTADQIFASSPSLTSGHLPGGVIAFNDNQAVLQDADIVVLSVKPAQVTEVMAEIGTHLQPQTVLLSIVAGVAIDNLAGYCSPEQAIVRSMPNMPIAVKEGATPLAANSFVSEQQKLQIERLLAQSSLINWCEEELMNAYTALSGSGPAYVFLFVEALIEGAQKLGLPADKAQQFAIQTLTGSAHILKKEAQSAAELRKRVTSPGGTTEAALHVFQQKHFSEIIAQALQAACTRAGELDIMNNTKK